MASNLLNYNVNTMSLARTYWGIPSSSFEMGAIPPSPVGFASGCRGSIASHLSGLRWYSPIDPRQTHGILSIRPSQTHGNHIVIQ